jgi:glucan biosynthesis protein C
MLQYVKGKAETGIICRCMTNTTPGVGACVSSLVPLLVLVVLTSVGVVLFKWLTCRPAGGATLW